MQEPARGVVEVDAVSTAVDGSARATGPLDLVRPIVAIRVVEPIGHSRCGTEMGKLVQDGIRPLQSFGVGWPSAWRTSCRMRPGEGAMDGAVGLDAGAGAVGAGSVFGPP